jgi:prephenate dehydratase
MKIVYPGAPGAFAHAASRLLFPDTEADALSTFAAVATAVRDGTADLGILPVWNNIAGDVPGVRSLILRHALRIAGSIDLPVRLHLMGLPGCEYDQLTTIVSHPVAIAQCRCSLGGMNVRLVKAESTALAASGLCDLATAALASLEAAELYGLTILKMNMQDRKDAITRFVLLRT